MLLPHTPLHCPGENSYQGVVLLLLHWPIPVSALEWMLTRLLDMNSHQGGEEEYVGEALLTLMKG